MYRLERKEFLKLSLIWLWALLGFQAGFLNSFGFLACGRYVSHVTGFGTQVGMEFGNGSFLVGLELLSFPLSFIVGAFTCGVWTSARIDRGLKPAYPFVTAFIPVFLMFLAYLGLEGHFGVFGESLTRIRDFALLCSLSFACGLQNACFATMTQGQIRTTHLTGISTDIGTDFARLWLGRLNPEENKLVKRANLSRIATFCFFGLGAITSVLMTENYHYAALIVPIVTAWTVFGVVIGISMKMTKKLNQDTKSKQQATVFDGSAVVRLG
jgi:uncharacterized membrane protein YoaK (UPF0700 family)